MDWRSMDETALIALAVLLEEQSQLNQTSDLALTEPQLLDNETLFHSEESKDLKDRRPYKRQRI